MEISFTISELIKAIVAMCTAITATAAAVAVIAKFISRIRAPDLDIRQRVEVLEKLAEAQTGYLATDKKRLDNLEQLSRVTMRALSALLSHGIDGNDVDSMKESKAEIYNYLINK